MIKKIFFYIFILLSCSTFAQNSNDASRYFYGFGASINKEVYKGYNQRTMLLPVIGYKGEKLNILGPFISYKLSVISDFSLLLQAAPRFQNFNDTDSFIFQGMKDRKLSIDAGASLNYKRHDWKVSFSSMFDVLNRSNGTELVTALSRTIRFGPVFIEPRLSFSYLSSDHVDYYYGVGLSESTINRPEYVGKSALNRSFELSVSTPIFFGGYTQLNLKRTWFSKEVTNSPLVGSSDSTTFRLSYSRNF